MGTKTSPKHRRPSRGVTLGARRVVVGMTLIPAVTLVMPAGAQVDDSSQNDSRSYGGYSTGPAPLETLAPNSNFPTPGAPSRTDLPPGVDLTTIFQSNQFCEPIDRPGLQAFGAILGDQWERPGYTTSRSCLDMKSEHYDGRAIDWQLNAFDEQDRRIGDEVALWLSANEGEMAKRFGIQSIIWNNRVFHAANGNWQGYTGQSPHTDHIHFSFSWDGAMMRTSWWTGVPVEVPGEAPCGVGCAEESPAHLTSPYTPYLAEVLAFGEKGQAVRVLQQGLGIKDDGIFGAQTAAALTEFTDDHPWLETREETSATLWHVLELQDYPTMPYRTLEISEGSQGYDVAVLQAQLEVETDGIFGPITAEAVAAGQVEAGLSPTGEVDGETWAALDVGIPGPAAPMTFDAAGGNVAPWTDRD